MMPYRIIVDSCTDLPKQVKEDGHVQIVPLTLIVEDAAIIDDHTFNQQDFLTRVKNSPTCPKSACPSPDDFMKYYDYDGDIYVVTISSQLSGSYNSAELAKRLYHEDHPNKKIEVIDSRSASVGQTLIALKIKELIENSHPFESVVEKVRTFRDGLKTKFVLENLDTLRKNGRLTSIQALLCSALNIKLVMSATAEGTIMKLGQARGIAKALLEMIKAIERDVVKPNEKTIAIAHCNNYECAKFVKEEILKRIPFKDCLIVDTAGVSSMYANEGGIITAY